MANTGSIDGSHSYLTFRGIANTSSVGTNSFNSSELGSNGGYVNLAIDVDDRLIGYGTINSVAIYYGVYGSRTNTLYKRCTARLGYIRTGSDNSGSFTWDVKRTQEAGRGSGDVKYFLDTIYPQRSNDGKYHLLMGGVNENTTLRQYIYFQHIAIDINYTPASYTLTVNAGTGGTVSGGGSYGYGTTATITATPNAGYTFKQWNDGNTNASRSVTVNGNATYTAEFTPKEFNIMVECVGSPSGEKCDISGGGTYKFGDTITLTATNIPPYHRFEVWLRQQTDNYYYTPTVSITIDESFLDASGNPLDVTFLYYLAHTGFRLYANVSPDSSVGTVDYGHFVEDYGYIRQESITADGVIVEYSHRKNIGIKATPTIGYKFIKWNDGNTDNPRIFDLTGDATYTAIFEKRTSTVTYQNEDGTVLQTSTIEYGSEHPPYTGDEPMKESTVQYHFDFVDWDYTLNPVTGDVVYTAVYQKTLRSYDIIVISLPNENNRRHIYPLRIYGSTVTITATHDSGYEFVRWEDGVTTPTRDVVVTGEATYTAYFRMNRIRVDFTKVKKILCDYDEVKAKLVDNTLVYEKCP